MQPRQAPQHHRLGQRSSAAPTLETATEGSRRCRTAMALPPTPPATANGEGGARDLLEPVGAPSAARHGRMRAEQEDGRSRLELRRGERAGEDDARLRDGWREDAGRVPDLRLAGTEVAGGGRSAAGGGGPCASASRARGAGEKRQA
ncbi:hypothetical protein ZWY2020_004615 [Hordeum vulgare]|nr:hypothetical protein ZWY2020_004615 [Hordeum vulgare]